MNPNFKILFLFLLSYSLQAQDTICIDKARLGRIADTLSHYKPYKQAFVHCDSLLSLERKLSALQAQKIIQKDTQLNILSNAFADCEKNRNSWEGITSEYKQNFEASQRKLAKAKRAKKGWMTSALTATGTMIVAIPLIIKFKK